MFRDRRRPATPCVCACARVWAHACICVRVCVCASVRVVYGSDRLRLGGTQRRLDPGPFPNNHAMAPGSLVFRPGIGPSCRCLQALAVLGACLPVGKGTERVSVVWAPTTAGLGNSRKSMALESARGSSPGSALPLPPL